MEGSVNRETQRSPEPTEKHQIHFEPGVHTFPFVDVVLRHPTAQELYDRFAAGDLTAHAWNPEVSQRMSKYGPSVIGLDSVSGSREDVPVRLFWLWLPGSPKEMTGRNEVYIVGGDLLHSQIIDPPRSTEDTISNEWYNELNKIGWGKVEEYAGGLGTELIGGHIALPIFTLLARRLLANKKREEDRGVKSPSRRLFLKRAAVTVGGLSLATFLGRLAPLAQSYSPTPKTEKVMQKVTDIAKPFTRSTWLDGRTALVIAKTIEAMDKLGLPQGSQGSVVMGFPHGYEAGNLLTDKQARMKAIRQYAQEFFNSIYPTIPQDFVWEAVALAEMEKAGDKLASDNAEDFFERVRIKGIEIQNNRSERWKRQCFMDIILPYFTATIVYRVKEPKSYHVDDPVGTVKELASVVKRFPSQEVKEAVSPLGDPERFQIKEKP
ncbi:MAG: hypothetical protein HYY87_00085 [Candidatus Levybacteria bacterium]|nr:hypothetical protein [Candidatus Levybacteria bacterium]